MITVTEGRKEGYYVYYALEEGSKRTAAGLREDYAIALDGEAIYPELLLRAVLQKVIRLAPPRVTLEGDWKIDPAPFGFVRTERGWEAEGKNLDLAPECKHNGGEKKC